MAYYVHPAHLEFEGGTDMSSARVGTADELSANVRSLIDRVLEADMSETVAKRGREIAAVIGEATETAADRAQVAWRDSAPQRRDATRKMQRAGRDAARWGRQTWKRELGPQMRDLWKRRDVALGAAGAAVPVGRELVDSAAARLRLRRREERHWRAFFLGRVLGAAAGAVIALLTTPKPGRAMRDELAEKARDAAENAGEWVPLFQRPETGNGGATSAPPDVRERSTDIADAAAGEGEELR
jgi:gas vesicle protein